MSRANQDSRFGHIFEDAEAIFAVHAQNRRFKFSVRILAMVGMQQNLVVNAVIVQSTASK